MPNDEILKKSVIFVVHFFKKRQKSLKKEKILFIDIHFTLTAPVFCDIIIVCELIESEN